MVQGYHLTLAAKAATPTTEAAPVIRLAFEDDFGFDLAIANLGVEMNWSQKIDLLRSH